MTGPRGSDYNIHKARVEARGNQGRHSLVGYQSRLEDARGGEYVGDSTEDFWDSDEADGFVDL